VCGGFRMSAERRMRKKGEIKWLHFW
jgi:hypothetical protein